MCKLKQLPNGKFVAEIKYDYIENIAKQAAKCQHISRIMLFGSSVAERCNNSSDIDIAVFGTQSKGKFLRSKEFRDFQKNLFTFGDAFGQDYDILYFTDGVEYGDAVLKDIEEGAEIYRRNIA